MEDLLEGLAPPEREPGVHVEDQREPARAHEAWKLWAAETGRDDGRTPSRAFVYAYMEALRAGRAADYLDRVVKGAARLPVKANNADDTRRVINALRTSSTARTALGALEAGHPVVPYPDGVHADNKCTIEQIAAVCKTTVGEWTERDQDAAGVVCVQIEADDLEDLATQARLRLGVDALLPLELLREARSGKRRGAAKTVSSRATYAAGLSEREQVRGVEFAVDDMAADMQARGAKAADIVALHAQAPEGYWDAVFQLAVEGESNEAAYRLLEPRFSWHPSQRAL